MAEPAGVVFSFGMMFNEQSLYHRVKARVLCSSIPGIAQSNNEPELSWKRRVVPERRSVPEFYCFVLTSCVSFRGESVSMLTSTAQVFSLCSVWSWLRIFAIAKDVLGVSRVSSNSVETVDVPQSLCSATTSTDPYLRDRLDRIAGLSITGHATHECYVSLCAIVMLARSASAVFDDNHCVRHT